MTPDAGADMRRSGTPGPGVESALEEAVGEEGFSTDECLDRILPLLRSVVEAHEQGWVVDLVGLRSVHVSDDGIWGLTQNALVSPTYASDRLRRIEDSAAAGVEVTGRGSSVVDIGSGATSFTRSDILEDTTAIEFPVHVRGYRTWESLVGHHDHLSDIFVLGSVLASLVAGLDLFDPDDHRRFVTHRSNLGRINGTVNPVVAKVIREMTEVDRRRRSSDLTGLIARLESYRDQPDDFDLDRIDGFADAPSGDRRHLVLQRLRDRLFDQSRRNRLLYFRPTQQMVDLTVASVPHLLDHKRIRPEQLVTWHPNLADQVLGGKPLRLGSLLRFEEATYLAGTLDKVIAQARRDRAEYGFAQLRLVIAFLRWHDLRGEAREVIDSPLLLLPVELSKKKGVRDAYVLEAAGSEAEVNPALRQRLADLYGLALPERVDLRAISVEQLHRILADQIQASEPAVSLGLVDRPRIDLIQRQAKLRAEVFARRQAGAVRRLKTAMAGIDYSYDRADYRPLGIQLFTRQVRPPAFPQRTTLGGKDDSWRTPAMVQTGTAGPGQVRQMYSLRRQTSTGDPYDWEIDLCRITLGNFNYRRMTLVQDYQRLLEGPVPASAFDHVFAVEGRPLDHPDDLPPTAEQFSVIDCDATQLKAVSKASSGVSYIVQGPPGTGKSQTITNLIADSVARGRRVLFVCEKRAAVDVVYHRLRRQGLDEFCCLIHDSQADKRAFIQDLKGIYEPILTAGNSDLDELTSQRQALVERIDEEFDDLRRLSAVLSGEVRGTGRTAVDLIDYLLKLRSSRPEQSSSGGLPDLAPEDEDLLPELVSWWEIAPAARRLERLLDDLTGNPMISDHALARIGPAVLGTDRPSRFARDLVHRAQRHSASLTEQLGRSALPPEVARDLSSLSEVTAGAALALLPLARLGALDLLDANSPRGRAFDELVEVHRQRLTAVEGTAAAASGWKQPPDAEAAVTALAAARRREGKALSGLSSGWRSARRLVDERYRPGEGGTVSVTGALEALVNHYDAVAGLSEVSTTAGERFGEPNVEILQELVARGRGIRSSPNGNTRDWFRTACSPGVSDEQLQTAAALHHEVGTLTDLVDQLLCQGAVEGGIANLELLLDELEEELDLLPSLLEPLRALNDGPDAAFQALRMLPLDANGIEEAAGRRALDLWFREDRAVARLDGAAIEQRVEDIAALRSELLDVNSRYVREVVRDRALEHIRLSNTPAPQLDAEGKQFKKAYLAGRRELEHEFGKVMRFRSIRDLAAGDAGIVIADLKPVWLMSPLSVSDTLPLDPDLFDIVIFDEASQVPVEEAVPSLHRAGQVIVVGDQMQLPPTSFFSSSADTEDDLSAEDDGESIAVSLDGDSFLNQAAVNLSSVLLAWHYRSRSESLIAFSNAAFYSGELRTIPERAVSAARRSEILVTGSEEAADGVTALLDRPISFHLAQHGTYESRRNLAEARYIAGMVCDLLKRRTGLSIGVVAFSEAQQSAIEDAIGRLSRTDAEFGGLLEAESIREEDDQFVGFFVKNLENVQGDERDIIILSICYGPDPSGRVRMNFGPINSSGGEKRLNVIFSRAKHHMAVVTSMRSHTITNDWNEGASALKSFLRFAEASSSGDHQQAGAVLGTLSARGGHGQGGGGRSGIVRELAGALEQTGLGVAVDLGESSLKCDLAVKERRSAHYQLAVLDGGLSGPDAGSHEHDRYVDKPRALKAVGWATTYVLGKDWLADPDAVLDRVRGRVTGKYTRPKAATSKTTVRPRTRSSRLPVPDETTAIPEAEPTPLGTPTRPPTRRKAASPPDPPVVEPEATPIRAVPAALAPVRSKRFEYVAGTSNKFWEIGRNGSVVFVTFGRIGTRGQTQIKDLGSEHGADAHIDKLVNSKLAKGYEPT